jgi:uncharacterized membrane protein
MRDMIVEAIRHLEDATEAISALIIAVGVVVATYQLLAMLLTARGQPFQAVRLKLSRSLAMALEFQLAADVLATTVTPSWDQLGRLGVIAVIRTFLNYFLAREIDSETQQ